MTVSTPPPDSPENSPEALAAARLCPIGGVGESAWIDVIRKMDEVYSNLLQHQVALEEKNAELEETQQFILSVLTSMSDVLIVCDLYGNVVEVNRALVGRIGRGEAELRGRPVGELRRAYQELHDTHEALKRAQQQLVHSEKVVSLGRLVAGVAHELNNPISFVLGNVHALQRYTQRLKSYLNMIHGGTGVAQREEIRKELRIDHILADLDSLIEGTVEGAERTRDIVEGLKRFSAKDEDEASQFNLAEVIAKAVHWVTLSSSAQCRVESDLPDDIPVLGNAGQIQQVVINLVQNALDATHGKDDALLAISGKAGGGNIEISFRDNGPGIDSAHLNRVFDPFFTTKTVGKGTGLGLSISYGIVDRHGGQLSAANHPDGGAVFTLRLPLAAAG